MLVNHANITEKNYRKLTLRISPDQVDYCQTDTLNQRILSHGSVAVSQLEGGSTEARYHSLLSQGDWAHQTYDEVIVLHDNGYNSFVPQALFDEDYLGGYLQFNTRVFETDLFAFDDLANYGMNNVFVPFANLNNLLLDAFGNFRYHHTATTLVKRLLDLSKNLDQQQVFAHIGEDRFELVVAHNQKLLLFNSFEYRTKEDFIYYLLFACEQLGLNPEQFRLQLLGNVAQDDALFTMAYRYVRNVTLLDVSEPELRNGLSQEDNRRHFILFQS